ncbi:hypothetical protein [Parabacteroides sp. FAFU027]|uniref:hypothetical protein n=1 Tax=Parabacteroides sp. FAFU027 TaxID=2922715 RepID=UPI001FAE92DB|nr:hypothetical protein [Parabacteroides sp. FAFU027]
MFFEEGHLYHIYNQGNNKQQIFFNRENYLHFLRKINTHILPHADILAWCLMPNHFHLMVYVNALTVTVEADTDGVTSSHPVSISPTSTQDLPPKQIIFNDNIAIMLRSYTRAIHKVRGSSGALFREATKAECITKSEGITPSFYNTHRGTLLNISQAEHEYPQVCFDYIHFNPVNAGLVNAPEKWEYSSYQDYRGYRNGKLINRNRAGEFGLHI